MNDGLIPSRYAKALFKYAVELGKDKEVYKQMSQLAISFEQTKSLQSAVENPYLSHKVKSELLLVASGAKKGGCVDKFITLTIENNRVSFIRSMALAFQSIYRKENSIVKVVVTTAVKIDKALGEKISQIAKQSTDAKTIEYEYQVNPDLIGGFKVEIEGKLLDASVKNELEKLRLKLLS